MSSYRMRDAAELLGVSDDTVRRWADGGRLPTVTDAGGRRAVEGAVPPAPMSRRREIEAPGASVGVVQPAPVA